MFCFCEKKCAASVTHMTAAGLRNLFLQAALAPETALRSGSVGAAFFLGGVGAELAPLPPPCTLGTLHTLRSTGQPPSLKQYAEKDSI